MEGNISLIFVGFFLSFAIGLALGALVVLFLFVRDKSIIRINKDDEVVVRKDELERLRVQKAKFGETRMSFNDDED